MGKSGIGQRAATRDLRLNAKPKNLVLSEDCGVLDCGVLLPLPSPPSLRLFLQRSARLKLRNPQTQGHEPCWPQSSRQLAWKLCLRRTALCRPLASATLSWLQLPPRLPALSPSWHPRARPVPRASSQVSRLAMLRRPSPRPPWVPPPWARRCSRRAAPLG